MRDDRYGPMQTAKGADARAGQVQAHMAPMQWATLFDLRGEDVCSEPLTVTLSWVLSGDATPGAIAIVEAQVVTGGGGHSNEVFVDVPAGGLVFQVVAAALRVSLRQTFIPPGDMSNFVDLGGHAARGVRPAATTQPIRTVLYGAIPAAGSEAQPIPAQAATVDVVCNPNTAIAPAVLTARFLDNAGAVVYEAPFLQRALPVPPRATQLAIVNHGAAPLVSARAIYSIAF